MLIVFTVLIVIVFLLSVGIFKVVRYWVEDVSPNNVLGVLIITAGVIFLYTLQGTGKTVKVLRYFLGDRELLGTLPLTWKQVYLANLLGRDLLYTAFIWLITGVIITTTVVTLGVSWQLILSWIITVPLFLIFIFVLRDCFAIVLAGLVEFLKIKKLTFFSVCLTPVALFKGWLTLFIIGASFTFVLSEIFTDASKLYNCIAEIFALMYEYMMYAGSNPLVWMGEALFYASLGRFMWLQKTFCLFLATAVVLLILERCLDYMECHKILPFDVMSESYVVKTRVKKYYPLTPTFNLSRIKMLYPVYFILRKDLIHLSRDPSICEQVFITISYVSIIVGILAGLWLAGIEVNIIDRIEDFSSSFTILPWFIVIFITFMVTKFTADALKPITSIDAEGRNIDLLRNAPISIRSLAYSKMILHFSILSVFAIITGIVCFIILKLPLLFLPLTILFALCISGVLSVIHVGATVFCPRFDWQHKGEVGGNYKAYFFRFSECFFVFMLYYMFFTEFILLKYFEVPISPGLLMVLVGTTIILASFIFIYGFLRAINKKLDAW